MEWKEVRFEDILAIPSRNGLTKPSAIRGSGVKMIAMGELFANPIIGDIPMDRVPVTEKELQNSSIIEGDLLFARQSLTLEGAGKCSYVEKVAEDTVFESHLIRIRIDKDKANPRFVFYYFQSPVGKHSVQNLVNQVAAAGIRGSELVKLELKIPTIDFQKRIADILSSLDAKIENNNKINAKLEEMAQALFKSWFIDFEPFKVGRDGSRPAFGSGNFVESELGMIPEGWKVVPLDPVVVVKRGGSPRPIQNYLSEEGYRWLKISDATSEKSPFIYNIAEHIIPEGLKKTVLMKAGELVLSNSATPGLPKFLGVDTCIHDGWLYFPESKLPKEFLYLLFQYKKDYLISQGNGSVFTNLKTDILKSMQIVLPPEDTIEKFHSVVESLFDMINKSVVETNNLAQTRDTLLPKLMSGEIEL